MKAIKRMINNIFYAPDGSVFSMIKAGYEGFLQVARSVADALNTGISTKNKDKDNDQY